MLRLREPFCHTSSTHFRLVPTYQDQAAISGLLVLNLFVPPHRAAFCFFSSLRRAAAFWS